MKHDGSSAESTGRAVQFDARSRAAAPGGSACQALVGASRRTTMQQAEGCLGQCFRAVLHHLLALWFSIRPLLLRGTFSARTDITDVTEQTFQKFSRPLCYANFRRGISWSPPFLLNIPASHRTEANFPHHLPVGLFSPSFMYVSMIFSSPVRELRGCCHLLLYMCTARTAKPQAPAWLLCVERDHCASTRDITQLRVSTLEMGTVASRFSHSEPETLRSSNVPGIDHLAHTEVAAEVQTRRDATRIRKV